MLYLYLNLEDAEKDAAIHQAKATELKALIKKHKEII